MRILPLSKIKEAPSDHRIISGAISGGDYSTYLREQIDISGGKICLRLEPIAVYITLPSYDGQGSPITQDELGEYILQYDISFSDPLCCNYIFISTPASVILFDDENSLQRKLQHAKEQDIPYVLLSDQCIKSKTP